MQGNPRQDQHLTLPPEAAVLLRPLPSTIRSLAFFSDSVGGINNAARRITRRAASKFVLVTA